MLFDSHKNVVSGKKLVFGDILGFLGGKLGPKIDQNHQLRVCPGGGGFNPSI